MGNRETARCSKTRKFPIYMLLVYVPTNGCIKYAYGLTISNPKLASIISNTKSAILAMSIMEFISLEHSIKVKRRFFPLTTVIGPLISVKLCFVYLLTSDFISVVFPLYNKRWLVFQTACMSEKAEIYLLQADQRQQLQLEVIR